MDKLTVGFIGWSPDYGNPRYTGAAPAPVGIQFATIGGPRKREQVTAEIEACERKLTELRWELAHMSAIPTTDKP